MAWMPSIERETAKGSTTLPIQTYLLTYKRRIYITGKITSETALEFEQQLQYLEAEDPEAPATVIINSPGGEVTSGLVIYDLIQAAKIPLDLYGTGTVASMAAILLASGQKGHRFLLPHSKMMIHEPLIEGTIGGSATSISNIADDIMEIRDLGNELLSKHTGQSLKTIRAATKAETTYTAEAAKEFGLIDEVKDYT